MIAFKTATSVPWAILPSAYQQILDVAEVGRLHGDELHARLESVATKLGRPLDNTRETTIREGGVAVIPICGPIARHLGLFSDISGGTTTEALAKDLETALSNPQVSSIVLEIDSPGGEVAGIGELASHIYAASLRKPVVAYVSAIGASAAYWLASATGEVIIAPAGMVGSIGVISGYTDTTEADKRRGIVKSEIASTQSPKKSPDMNTEDGKAVIQDMVNSLADVFISAVASYRDCSVATVIQDFGQGALLVGQAAVDAGMADRLGTLEGVIAELAADPEGMRAKLVRTKVDPKPKPKAVSQPSMKPKGQPVAKSFKERAMAFFSGLPDNFDPVAEEHIEPPVASKTPVAVPVTTPDPELAKLQAQVLQLQKANETALAEAHANWLTSTTSQMTQFLASNGSKVLAIEVPSLQSSLIQAAIDDKSTPLASGSRVDTIKSTITARAPHGLLVEHLGNDPLPAGLKALDANAGGPKAVTPESVAGYLGMTDDGKALLARNNGKLPIDPLLNFSH